MQPSTVPGTEDIPEGISDADLAAELTRRAAELAQRMREEGVHGRRKTSVSDVVTEADHAAEELVAGTLARLRPQDGIVGEEGAARPSSSGRTWVIDPVDGTYNFLAGLDTWCSALALREGDELLLGAVHRPASGEAWLGGRELPTTLGGRPVGELADLPLAEVAMATYLHPGVLDREDLREPWLAAISGAATVRMFGSGSCDLGAVAADGVQLRPHPVELARGGHPGRDLAARAAVPLRGRHARSPAVVAPATGPAGRSGRSATTSAG